jgi:hypothetical protein
MINAFHDYKRSSPVDLWYLAHDPLQQQFHRWKAGEISHLETDEAIHTCQKVHGLFTSKRNFLVRTIQFNEE